jgi:hypothetical protein
MKHIYIHEVTKSRRVPSKQDVYLHLWSQSVTRDNLVAAYKFSPKIKGLRLCHLQDLPTDLRPEVKSFLDSLSIVNYLSLEQTIWTDPMACSIANYLQKCPIRKLSVWICKFAEESKPLALFLQTFKTLESFELCQNTFDKDDGTAIRKASQAISKATHLRDVRINNFFIKDHDMGMLLEACATLPLKSFDLSWACDKLQKHHVDLLHRLHSLETLTLRYSFNPHDSFNPLKPENAYLKDETVKSIIQLLQHNPGLKEFELSGSGVYFDPKDPEALNQIMSKPMYEKLLKYVQDQDIAVLA